MIKIVFLLTFIFCNQKLFSQETKMVFNEEEFQISTSEIYIVELNIKSSSCLLPNEMDLWIKEKVLKNSAINISDFLNKSMIKN